MKRFYQLLALASFTAWLSTPALAATLSIQSAKANGSACPPGSTTITTIDSDYDGSTDLIQVTFSEFFVERPGRTVKNCLLELLVNVPRGYQFSVFRVNNKGFVDIHNLHNGRIDTQYEFPFVGRWTAPVLFNGPYSGEFEYYADFPASSWSPCNVRVPLNLNTRASITRKTGVLNESMAYSIIQVERSTARFIQYYYINWRYCI